jgi:pyruvate dehydrogenase E2 component (dihydrolipoamide acetyltransferase)
MPADVIMPALEMAQETGKVVRWLKAEGETVAKGEPLLEIETDKVTVEIEAPADGLLAGIRAAEGDEVPVGEAIAVVLQPGEELTAARTASQRPGTAVRTARAAAARGGSAPERSRDQAGGRRLVSPKARRLAAARGVDLDAVAGSGPGGAVVAADLEAMPVSGDDVLELGSVWKTMAERTTRSWQTAPHIYLRREVDASGLQRWRADVRSRPDGEGVTYTDLLVKLTAVALRRHPRVNCSWRDGAIVAGAEVNIALAVATDDGLVAPVVHAADRLDLPAIAARRSEIATAARERRLRPEDVGGGSFTISNLGMYGVDSFDAVVNPPQAAILAVGRIRDRVVALGGQPAVRPMLELTVSFDHRVVDGARGAEFLDTLASLAEEPAGMEA